MRSPPSQMLACRVGRTAIVDESASRTASDRPRHRPDDVGDDQRSIHRVPRHDCIRPAQPVSRLACPFAILASPARWPMTFYATIDADSIRSYMPAVPYLLPASSWARYQLRPVRLPRRLRHVAADCGGFVATRIWGDYRFNPTQYVSWLHT